jgi:hypothetical protein
MAFATNGSDVSDGKDMSAPRLWIRAVIAALRHEGFGDNRPKSSNIYLIQWEEILSWLIGKGPAIAISRLLGRSPRNDLGRFGMLRDEQIRPGGSK